MPDQQAYDASIVDPARIRSYARKIAGQVQGRRPTVTHQYRGIVTRGWIISNYREEGARDSGRFSSWESGHLFFLREDGELMRGQYQVTTDRYDDACDPLRTPDCFELEFLADSDMTWLDRPPADLHYRKVRSSSGEREEMRAKYYLKVHAKGVGLSVALKRLT
ncbi:hypothetical protein [Nocardia sp. NPDC049149]|uniref:hypothetical protein n=1 Tax=Nocardia sp. NPDC049149 TaxID=3364315 RepID=UPI00371AA788